jgi:hypothetical protein
MNNEEIFNKSNYNYKKGGRASNGLNKFNLYFAAHLNWNFSISNVSQFHLEVANVVKPCFARSSINLVAIIKVTDVCGQERSINSLLLCCFSKNPLTKYFEHDYKITIKFTSRNAQWI